MIMGYIYFFLHRLGRNGEMVEKNTPHGHEIGDCPRNVMGNDGISCTQK